MIQYDTVNVFNTIRYPRDTLSNSIFLSGELGSKSLMLIPVIAGTHVRISADTSNITIRQVPRDFKFDFNDICRPYSLSLDDPVERSIAILLLHIVAAHHTWVPQDCSYEFGKARPQTLNFVTSWLEQDKDMFNREQHELEAKLRRLIASCSDIETATTIFSAVDVDGGGVDHDQFSLVLGNMGIELDAAGMNEVFDTYDLNQDGTIDLSEFCVFLRRHLGTSEARLRDLTHTPCLCLASTPTIRYLPPRAGRLNITVVDGFLKKKVYRTMTDIERQGVEDIASTSGEYSTMMMNGLFGSKIRFHEASAVYAKMFQETRVKSRILSSLLPQLDSTLDARLLVDKSLANDKREKLALQRQLGTACRPMFGRVNGYYMLDCAFVNHPTLSLPLSKPTISFIVFFPFYVLTNFADGQCRRRWTDIALLAYWRSANIMNGREWRCPKLGLGVFRISVRKATPTQLFGMKCTTKSRLLFPWSSPIPCPWWDL